MAWQLWLAEPGPRLNSPRTCSPIWSGGAQTHIVCVPTKHSEERSCSREGEVADFWRNETSSGLRRWQLAEHIDDGLHAKCFLTPCRGFPLEHHASLVREEWHVTRKSVKVPAEALGCSLISGRGGLSGLSNDNHPARYAFTRGLSNYPRCPMTAPPLPVSLLFGILPGVGRN